MAILVLKTKTRVPDLLTELFGALSPAERTRASEEFVAANPHIGRKTNLNVGSVLIIPHKYRPKAEDQPGWTREVPSAVALLERAREELKELGKSLKAAAVAEGEKLKATDELLKSRELRTSDEFERISDSVLEARKNREKEIQAKKEFVEVLLPRVEQDLEQMLHRLGNND